MSFSSGVTNLGDGYLYNIMRCVWDVKNVNIYWRKMGHFLKGYGSAVLYAQCDI